MSFRASLYLKSYTAENPLAGFYSQSWTGFIGSSAAGKSINICTKGDFLMTYQLNAEYFHEFKPEFSWFVFAVLVGVLVIGYLLGKSETRISKITNSDRKVEVTVRYASGATHAAFTILAFMASWAVILHEHLDGILQSFFNLSGNGTGELSVYFASLFFTFIFCACYAALAYGVMNKGIKMSIHFARGNYGDLKVERHNNMIQDFKASWNSESKGETAEKTAAKISSIIPAMGGTRVTTR